MEELVPIRPAGAEDSARVDVGDESGGIDETPPGADAFWSEDAGVLHNALQAPAGERGRHAAPERSAPRHRWPTGRAVGHAPRRLRYVGAAAVAIAVMALAVIGTLWGSGNSAKPTLAGHPTSTQAAAVGSGASQMSRRKTLPDTAGTRARSRRAVQHRAASRSARVRHQPGRGRHAGGARAPTTGGTPASATASGSTATSASGPASATSPSPPTPAVPVTTPATTTPPPASTTSTGSPASSGSTPAFGSSGALGPGSSPNS